MDDGHKISLCSKYMVAGRTKQHKLELGVHNAVIVFNGWITRYDGYFSQIRVVSCSSYDKASKSSGSCSYYTGRRKVFREINVVEKDGDNFADGF